MERSEELIGEIRRRSYSCIISNGSTVHKLSGRGISLLLHAYADFPQDLCGSTVYDKIIGKAAAMILVCAGVKEIYAEVLSEQAVPVLKQHGVAFRYETCVPYIINRKNTGMCPMESCVQGVTEPDEALSLLRAKLEKMQNQAGKRDA